MFSCTLDYEHILVSKSGVSYSSFKSVRPQQVVEHLHTIIINNSQYNTTNYIGVLYRICDYLCLINLIYCLAIQSYIMKHPRMKRSTFNITRENVKYETCISTHRVGQFFFRAARVVKPSILVTRDSVTRLPVDFNSVLQIILIVAETQLLGVLTV